MAFQSGFVTIIGRPNAGKSTLLNALLGEKISIITRKAQTTRHRIKGILTTDNYQLVFSDTPGIIETKYELHKSMMKTVEESLEDADLLLVIVDPTYEVSELNAIHEKLSAIKIPLIVVINKSDAVTAERLEAARMHAEKLFLPSSILTISALQKINLDNLITEVLKHIPEQPAFYSDDEFTDKSERFVVSELIREKIFEQFHKEVPYSSQVLIQDWKEQKGMIHIRAEVIVERNSQMAILLGKGGIAIKQLGIAARKDIEAFLGKKIFLGLTVKVNANWRNNISQLKYFGYEKS